MVADTHQEKFQEVELFGKPALFTNARIDSATVPDGWFWYDLRGSDYDPGEPVTIEPHVLVNHAGSILTHDPVKFRKGQDSRRLRDGLNFVGGVVSLKEFCEEHQVSYTQDNHKYQLRPASESEAGLFYAATPEVDHDLACIGHIRMDFGHGGKEFWHTWWPRGEDSLNSTEFQQEVGAVVDTLRKTILKNLQAMSSYCDQHGGELGSNAQQYGYVVETDNYRYCLRCNPKPGDYQGYLTCYDKRQQALNMAQKDEIIGKVSFASGETLAYTDPDIFVQVIKDELPFRSTSGFQYEVLSNSSSLRKAVDDVLYDLCGEQNPRRECNYGLTEKGKQMLRDAADPSRSHSYVWFVMSAVNTPNEQLVTGLTLPDAIQQYQKLNTGNKRIGVTKDKIATVDLVVMLQGEEEFLHDHEKLASFQNDPVITEAVSELHQALDTQTPAMGMNLGGM